MEDWFVTRGWRRLWGNQINPVLFLTMMLGGGVESEWFESSSNSDWVLQPIGCRRTRDTLTLRKSLSEEIDCFRFGLRLAFWGGLYPLFLGLTLLGREELKVVNSFEKRGIWLQF